MDFAIALIALAIAWWQLSLQRKEISRNGKISALVNMSQMIRDRITFYSEMIDDLKAAGKPWKGHANVINQELRPLLAKVNKEIIDLSQEYRFGFSGAELKEAIRVKDEDLSEPRETSQAVG